MACEIACKSLKCNKLPGTINRSRYKHQHQFTAKNKKHEKAKNIVPALILLALQEKVKRALVVLKLHNKSTLQVASDAKHYVTCMTTNATTFTNPTPTLAAISALIDAVLSAETASRKAIGAATDLAKIAKRDLMAALKVLAMYVENLANLNPKTAVATIHLAGMEVKSDGVFEKPAMNMKPGKHPGELEITVKAGPRQTGHDYWLSTDGVNFKLAMKSDVCRVTITGLISGTLYYGKVMRTIRGGEIQIGQIAHSYVL